jgi:hypothetical protein
MLHAVTFGGENVLYKKNYQCLWGKQRKMHFCPCFADGQKSKGKLKVYKISQYFSSLY